MQKSSSIISGWASIYMLVNCVFHLAIGSLALAAGIVVLMQTGDIIPSIGLMGAASFALVNGAEGFIDLFKSARYRTPKARRYKGL